MRDNLDVIRDVNELTEVISTVEDCGDVYFVPAFSGLFAPYWKKEARGYVLIKIRNRMLMANKINGSNFLLE